MDIRSAFQQVQADETLCTKRTDGKIYFCYSGGTFSAFTLTSFQGETIVGQPFQYANKKGQESFNMDAIFADYEVVKISELS
jgi:hypothetical protein